MFFPKKNFEILAAKTFFQFSVTHYSAVYPPEYMGFLSDVRKNNQHLSN